MERTRNFEGHYEAGHDQHVGNVYTGSVYFGASTHDKPSDPGAESGDPKKLPLGPNEDEDRKPSLEGMLCSRRYINQDTNLDRIPCFTQIPRIVRARRQHHGQSRRYLQLDLAL
jgi:hypothetical protein